MSIISRFSDIMKSNINALLDKCEDPAKMIDQCLRDLEKSLSEVKAETAGVIAEETRTKRLLDECNSDVIKMSSYAEKALVAGNEDDARKFIEKKQQLTAKLEDIQKTYDLAHLNAEKMRQMHDKLCKDISELNSRKETIKAKIAVARAQEKVNQAVSGIDTAGSIRSFEKMEAKADQMLDRANAMTDLNSKPMDEMEDLTSKYGTTSSVAVDDELAALKAKLGM